MQAEINGIFLPLFRVSSVKLKSCGISVLVLLTACYGGEISPAFILKNGDETVTGGNGRAGFQTNGVGTVVIVFGIWVEQAVGVMPGSGNSGAEGYRVLNGRGDLADDRVGQGVLG